MHPPALLARTVVGVDGQKHVIRCNTRCSACARLFEALNARDEIMFFPVSYTHAPGTLATVGRLAAINSAVEVDLTGQVNAEEVGGRRLGAVGGQVDFLRAAAAHGGKPIIALPAKRIVASLDGPVSTARSDVDWIVTEHGACSLRGLSESARVRELLRIAGAERAELLSQSAAPNDRGAF